MYVFPQFWPGIAGLKASLQTKKTKSMFVAEDSSSDPRLPNVVGGSWSYSWGIRNGSSDLFKACTDVLIPLHTPSVTNLRTLKYLFHLRNPEDHWFSSELCICGGFYCLLLFPSISGLWLSLPALLWHKLGSDEWWMKPAEPHQFPLACVSFCREN